MSLIYNATSFPPTFFSDLRRSSFGLEEILDSLISDMNQNNHSGFPPYNMIRKGNDTLIVEMAVAGFNKDEIQIVFEPGRLRISAQKKEKEDEEYYLYKGIAFRDFSRSLSLGKFVEVKSAKLESGLLIIELHQNIPDEMKPKTIELN